MPSSTTSGRTLVYRYQNGLYINLTNRCPTACRFCVKFGWKMNYRGYDLKLQNREPSVAEILEAMDSENRRKPFSEAVFCGYGESTYRLSEMLELCSEIAGHWGVRRRLNTIGLGDLIWGRSISPEFRGRLDAVSVSLNTADPEEWLKLHNPLPEFREAGFASVLDFIRECARAVPDTTVTAVAQGVDAEACRRLAFSLGAKFRLRPLLDEDESA